MCGWNYLSIPKLSRHIYWSLGMDKWFHSKRLKLINISKGGPLYQNGESNTNLFLAIIN